MFGLQPVGKSSRAFQPTSESYTRPTASTSVHYFDGHLSSIVRMISSAQRTASSLAATVANSASAVVLRQFPSVDLKSDETVDGKENLCDACVELRTAIRQGLQGH
jgi:hypothetical protein